jgi:hypothetical protein
MKRLGWQRCAPLAHPATATRNEKSSKLNYNIFGKVLFVSYFIIIIIARGVRPPPPGKAGKATSNIINS